MKVAQYYAHPRNAFWPIAVATIQRSEPCFKRAHAINYEQRINLAVEYGLALWDVLSHCTRPGSLDSSIERASEVANPIAAWLESHPSVSRVCFNGKTAAAAFRRHLSAELEPTLSNRKIEFLTLPSTSPAMATLSLEEKNRTVAACSNSKCLEIETERIFNTVIGATIATCSRFAIGWVHTVLYGPL